MNPKNDYPPQEKLEKTSNFLLNFDSKVDSDPKFTNDMFKQLGLLFHDLRRGINHQSLIVDFIKSVTKLSDLKQFGSEQPSLELTNDEQ